jgi:hypothetical protein
MEVVKGYEGVFRLSTDEKVGLTRFLRTYLDFVDDSAIPDPDMEISDVRVGPDTVAINLKAVSMMLIEQGSPGDEKFSDWADYPLLLDEDRHATDKRRLGDEGDWLALLLRRKFDTKGKTRGMVLVIKSNEGGMDKMAEIIKQQEILEIAKRKQAKRNLI